jgi:signal peptidase I
VILKDPMDPSKDFIKRIIGLPGERIMIRNRQVFVNARPLEERYVSSVWVATPNWPDQPAEPDGEVVPPATYFVLGDNRDHSSDSRLFGYISRDQIEGKAVVRIWPFRQAALLDARPTLAKEP